MNFSIISFYGLFYGYQTFFFLSFPFWFLLFIFLKYIYVPVIIFSVLVTIPEPSFPHFEATSNSLHYDKRGFEKNQLYNNCRRPPILWGRRRFFSGTSIKSVNNNDNLILPFLDTFIEKYDIILDITKIEKPSINPIIKCFLLSWLYWFCLSY